MTRQPGASGMAERTVRREILLGGRPILLTDVAKLEFAVQTMRGDARASGCATGYTTSHTDRYSSGEAGC